MDYSIDFKKYKRVFVFGCSFTNYYWPTWADIIVKEMPDAEYYNFGKCGAGNFFITSRIVEANIKMKFTDTDLILVMWTSLCREDRYIHGNWSCPGNIFTQNIYSEDFVSRFCDPAGYLIKDLSLIQMATTYLENTPSDKLIMNCQPFDIQQDKNDQLVNRILDAHSELINNILPNMFDLEMNQHWSNGHEYFDSNHGNFKDYHPNPFRYYSYLKKLGINLTDTSKSYALESLKKLMLTKTKEDIINTFGNEPNANHNTVRNICF
jgi:hypothetical protein